MFFDKILNNLKKDKKANEEETVKVNVNLGDGTVTVEDTFSVNDILTEEEWEKRKETNENELKELEKELRKMDYCHDEYKKAFDLFHNNEINLAQKKLEHIIYMECEAPPAAYSLLADIYHYNKDFSNEKKVLEDYFKKYGNDRAVNEGNKNNMRKSLENVNSFLITGNWDYDCLPITPKKIQDENRKIKTYLKTDKDRAIEELEKILVNGTYVNTVYYTLYQHFKNKDHDKTVKICELAVKELGLFSVDRKNRWSLYLEKELSKRS